MFFVLSSVACNIQCNKELSQIITLTTPRMADDRINLEKTMDEAIG